MYTAPYTGTLLSKKLCNENPQDLNVLTQFILRKEAVKSDIFAVILLLTKNY